MCEADHSDIVCTCAKGFWVQTFTKQLSMKYQIFMKLPLISHVHKKRKAQNLKLIDQLLRPYEFYHFYGMVSTQSFLPVLSSNSWRSTSNPNNGFEIYTVLNNLIVKNLKIFVFSLHWIACTNIDIHLLWVSNNKIALISSWNDFCSLPLGKYVFKGSFKQM